MADLKISQALASKPAAALDGTEAFYALQAGETKGATIEQAREYVASQPNVFGVTQTIEDAAPALRFSENDTVDQNWEFIGVAGALRLDELSDAFATTGTHTTFTHGGGVQVGAPTGGDQGAGTINAEGLYQNGASALIESTSGVVIQQAIASTGAVISTTNILPHDDTIPQDTEGGEALSINFTPKRSDSRIRIRANIVVRPSATDIIVSSALFIGGTSDALAASAFAGDAAAPVPGMSTLSAVADVASPGVTASTFSVRFGPQTTGTVYLNANSSGVRRFGGVAASTLEIMEYMP